MATSSGVQCHGCIKWHGCGLHLTAPRHLPRAVRAQHACRGVLCVRAIPAASDGLAMALLARAASPRRRQVAHELESMETLSGKLHRPMAEGSVAEPKGGEATGE